MRFQSTTNALLPALIGAACLTFASAAPTADQMKTFLKSRPENDEIQWKDASRGAAFTVRLIDSSPQGLNVEKQLNNGLTQRKVPLGDIGAIKITLTPAETSLQENPEADAAPALGVLWEARKATITLTGSNVSETGIAYAKALRAVNTEESLAEAESVLSTITAKAAEEHRIAVARSEMEVLAFVRAKRAGNTNQTDELAWKITENASEENSDAMLIATDWLADRHFTKLKAIEEDNPRWSEDNEVKPERDGLYNLALDFALYPSLFETGNDAKAATGLAKAARVYKFTGENELLKNVLEDLASLYPDSPEAKENSALLAELKQAETKGNLSKVESKPNPETDDEPEEAESPEEEPATPKRYNIFGD